MKPFISIIIPVYNVEAYLRGCLESIVMQDFNSIEVILVDDGSPDCSPSICDEYSESYQYIKVIHKKNGGVGSARNVGLDLAEGEWIWFVDGDDMIKEHSLFILADAIRNNPCDTIVHGLVNLYDDGSVMEGEHEPDTESERNVFLAKHFCFQNGMMLFNAAIIKQNQLKFAEGIKIGEDLEFQYRYLMLCKKPIRIDGNLYIYRRREGSALTNPNSYKNTLHNNITNVVSLLHFIDEHNIPSHFWIEKRIQLLLKASIQSALRVQKSNRGNLQTDLRTLVTSFKKCGFAGIEDSTIRLACLNLDIYLFVLNLYFKIKGIKY